MDRPDLAYKVISGAPSGLYFLLTPLASLETLDEILASVPMYASDAAKEVRQIGAADNIARENQLSRVNPELSYVSTILPESTRTSGSRCQSRRAYIRERHGW